MRLNLRTPDWRALTFSILIVTQVACSLNIKSGIPNQIPQEFVKEFIRNGLDHCEWRNFSIKKSKFSGSFTPADEHNPDFIRINDDLYVIFLSDDLFSEMRSSVDGMGGKRRSDFLKHWSRKNIQGYLIDSDLLCPSGTRSLVDYKIALFGDYGKASNSE